ncbi:hypothetical protein J2S74_002912 [Evansella vedderi]|uniref:Uncharacterized protein n=1 Tax=Evansella vedderi TaxID=38282 RepID=A0ABT9ZX43_9BACI|nr:hypothetical protein [Evansella vedderi]MDQ0255530.1 hypothetical protein [Evansella vedderi]
MEITVNYSNGIAEYTWNNNEKIIAKLQLADGKTFQTIEGEKWGLLPKIVGISGNDNEGKSILINYILKHAKSPVLAEVGRVERAFLLDYGFSNLSPCCLVWETLPLPKEVC